MVDAAPPNIRSLEWFPMPQADVPLSIQPEARADRYAARRPDPRPAAAVGPAAGNNLLRSLSAADLALLSPHLHPVDLPMSKVLEHDGLPVATVFFPDEGLVSIVVQSAEGRRIEAGIVGFEGMTGMSVLLGDDRATTEAYVQITGWGQMIAASALRSALRASASLKDRLLQYSLTHLTQLYQAVLANGRNTIDERLSRWLLMADDRLDGSDIALTHEFLALMLGVRRAGVTEALHRLEGDMLIRSRRGRVTIRDRNALESRAAGAYGAPEAVYSRLFGGVWRSSC
jgi:CRP-like cAMP-binding protein